MTVEDMDGGRVARANIPTCQICRSSRCEHILSFDKQCVAERRCFRLRSFTRTNIIVEILYEDISDKLALPQFRLATGADTDTVLERADGSNATGTKRALSMQAPGRRSKRLRMQAGAKVPKLSLAAACTDTIMDLKQQVDVVQSFTCSAC